MEVVSRGELTHHVMVDHNEFAICEGKSFTFVESITLGVAEVHYIAMTTPNVCLRVRYSVEGSGQFILASHAGPVYTGGTAANVLNRNFNSSNTLGADLIIDPTVSDEGTELNATTYGSSKKAGGDTAIEGFLLPKNTPLMYKITSNTVDNDLIIRLNFVQEDDY